MVIVSHDLARPECGSQWLRKTKSDTSLWSLLRHEFIHACAGELAGTGRNLKSSHLSSAAWVETRHCMIWLSSATCTGSSNRPVCFNYWSLRILDFLFDFFLSLPQIFLSNLEYVHYYNTCISCSCCKMLVKHCSEDWKGHRRMSFRITNELDWDELHI